MKLLESQRGVTALSMVVVVIVMIIIASFSVFSSRDLIKESLLAKVYNEINMVKDAVKDISLDDSYKESILSSMKITDLSEYNSRVGGTMTTDKTYYYIGYNDSSVSEATKKELDEYLGLRNIKNNYVICIKDYGMVEVMIVDGVKSEGNTYYTYDEISRAYTNVTKK